MKILKLSSQKALLSLCAGIMAMGVTHAKEDTKYVAITAIVEHPALDSLRDGVIKGLSEKGYKEGENLKIKYQSAQGNTGTAAQIARQFVGDKPDAIVGIGTPSAQALAAATKSIPVVFAAVTDPIAAQLVSSKDPSGSNITGASDELPLGDQIDLILKIAPDTKKIGMVYNPGEANSVSVVKQLKKLLDEHDIQLVEASAPRTVDVGSAARSLANKVDLIYTNTDNNVVAAYEALVKVAKESRIPLIASDTDSVERGAIAALGIDYKAMGEQTSELIKRIFEGEKPGEIAYETSDDFMLYLNKKAAEQQGVKLDQSLLDSATKVFE